MKDSLILQDKIYISARRVHELFGYTSDYVGQLCRSGKLECKMIGRSWFVTEKSVIDHRSEVNELIKSRVKEKRQLSRKLYNSFSQSSQKVVPTVLSSVVNHVAKVDIGNNVTEPGKFLLLCAPVYPITPVPFEFSLPFSISQSFLTSPVIENRKSSNLLFSRVIISSGMLAVCLFFVLQTLSLDNLLLSTTQDMTAVSIAAVSNNFSYKLVSFLSAVPKLAVEIFSEDSSVAINQNNSVIQNFNGIAVVPSTNSELKDEIIKNKIKASFSDDVAVKPDSSGTSGVITPVFRKAKGDDFVYVMVPINTQ